jgi:hypothetical protein
MEQRNGDITVPKAKNKAAPAGTPTGAVSGMTNGVLTGSALVNRTRDQTLKRVQGPLEGGTIALDAKKSAWIGELSAHYGRGTPNITSSQGVSGHLLAGDGVDGVRGNINKPTLRLVGDGSRSDWLESGSRTDRFLCFNMSHCLACLTVGA